MKNLLFISISLLLPVFACVAQSEEEVILLWEGSIPCESNLIEEIEERDIGRAIRKVHTPSMTVHQPHPDSINGTAVIICPGGGYTILAWDWEGTKIAKWFNSIGVTAFVLKYRLPHWESEDCRDVVALTDAQQAMRLVRSKSKEYSLNPERIGIMGFSAGGHLASTLSTHFDLGDTVLTDVIRQTSCRPDFSILIYPVISCDSAFAHQGSCKNLLGENPTTTELDHFSNEKQVAVDTPPAILIHASDDQGVAVENSIVYYQALVRHGIPASMHVFPSGGHGFSMGKPGSYESSWPGLCHQWLISMKFIN